jgi:hypothetical protein
MMEPSGQPLPEDLILSLRLFSFFLGNGTVNLEVLPLDMGDYRHNIVQYGSELEQIYTIFLRNLRIEADGKILGAEYAQRRAAQWIRRYCDPSYVIEPPFTDRELELGEP